MPQTVLPVLPIPEMILSHTLIMGLHDQINFIQVKSPDFKHSNRWGLTGARDDWYMEPTKLNKLHFSRRRPCELISKDYL